MHIPVLPGLLFLVQKNTTLVLASRSAPSNGDSKASGIYYVAEVFYEVVGTEKNSNFHVTSVLHDLGVSTRRQSGERKESYC